MRLRSENLMSNLDAPSDKSLFQRYWPALAGIAFTFLLAFSLFLIRSNLSQIENYPTRSISANEESVIIDIQAAESGLDIAKELYAKGVTASITSFYQLAINDSRAIQIAPGQHQLNLKLSAKQALEQLLDPKRNIGLVAVVEGAWRSEIFSLLKSRGFSDLAQAANQVKLPKGFEAREGVFFPAQYSFARGTTSTQALQQMVDRFVSEAGKEGLFSAPKPFEKLIIASIIQAEGHPGDFEKVSRVIYNRLKIGMPLQMDSTVQYVLKRRGSIWLSTNATKVNSPYNTYQRYGLPIAPIGNPGREAIRAALKPAPGDWLYFITVKPGDTRFTKSHDEFLQWKNEYLKNLKAGAFK